MTYERGRLHVTVGGMRIRFGRIWIPDGLHLWWGSRGLHLFWHKSPYTPRVTRDHLS